MHKIVSPFKADYGSLHVHPILMKATRARIFLVTSASWCHQFQPDYVGKKGVAVHLLEEGVLESSLIWIREVGSIIGHQWLTQQFEEGISASPCDNLIFLCQEDANGRPELVACSLTDGSVVLRFTLGEKLDQGNIGNYISRSMHITVVSWTEFLVSVSGRFMNDRYSHSKDARVEDDERQFVWKMQYSKEGGVQIAKIVSIEERTQFKSADVGWKFGERSGKNFIYFWKREDSDVEGENAKINIYRQKLLQ